MRKPLLVRLLLAPFFKSVIFGSVFFGAALEAHANKPPQWGVSAGPGFSFTSYHFSLTTTYRYADNAFYFGPRLTSNSYVPASQPYGGLVGWRHRLGGRRLQSFLGAEYQLTVYKPVGRNQVQEVFWNYGIEFPFTNEITVGNSLGYGASLESYQPVPGGKTTRFVSPDGLLRLYVQYEFR